MRCECLFFVCETEKTKEDMWLQGLSYANEKLKKDAQSQKNDSTTAISVSHLTQLEALPWQ